MTDSTPLPMQRTVLTPGVRPPSEYGETWHPPDPPKATVWATEPPEGIALTADERRVRVELEERRRRNEATTNGFTGAVKREQDRRAAELAARYALPAAELRALLEEHTEELRPYYVAAAEASGRNVRAQEDRERAAAFAREKASTLERLEVAERADFDDYSRACAEALSAGEIPVPYTGAIDVAALHAARVEARAAAEALRRIDEAGSHAAAALLDGPRRDLEIAVDRLIYEKLVAPKIARLRAAYDELQQLRPLIWGYKAAGIRDARFIADTADLDEAIAIKPAMPGSLPDPVARAAHEWRERRAVLIAGDLPQRTAAA